MRVGRGYRGKKAQPVDLEPKYPGKYVCRYNCVLYLEVYSEGNQPVLQSVAWPLG